MRPAVFLDRDDTLIATSRATAGSRSPGDLGDPMLVELLPGVAAGLRMLHEAGFLLVVVSSQGGVARGVYGPREVESVHDRLRELLMQAGVPLAGVYYCPFHPKGTVPAFAREHDWRKPAPGMFRAAIGELQIDPARSWSIGDKPRDAGAAVGAGVDPRRAIVLGSPPHSECCDVLAAARHILASGDRS